MRVLVAILSLSLTACLFPALIDPQSPEAVTQETRRYEQGPGHVRRATVAALEVLGYEVVVDEPGRIRTAPKVALVQAAGTAYQATAVEASVGWEVQISAAGGATALRAIPHGYSGGQETHGAWNKAFFESSLNTLFHEIDEQMVAKTAEPSGKEADAPAKPAAAPKRAPKRKKPRASVPG